VIDRKAPRSQGLLRRGFTVTVLAVLLTTCILPSEPRTPRIGFVLPSDTVLVAAGGTVAAPISVLVDGKSLPNARIRLESRDSSLATIVEPNRIVGHKRGADSIRVVLLTGASGASPPETSFVARVIVSAMRPLLSDTTRGRATLAALGDSLFFRPGYLAADGTPLSPSDSATITPRYELAAGGVTGRAVRVDAASGKIVAVANGTDTIRASVDTAHAYFVVTVRQRAARVQVSPSTVQFNALTATQQLVVQAWDKSDSLIAQPVVSWSSTNPGAVSIGPTPGLVAAVANGTAGVTATVDSVSDTTGVTVQQVPMKLAFTVQPNRTVAGGVISPPVQVTVQDSLGMPVASSTTLITLSIGANPGRGTLSGTVSRSAVNGVAKFSDLSIASAGAGYTLVATASGLAGATSSAFDIDPGAPAKVAFIVQPTTIVAGNTIGPAVQVAIQDPLGNTVPSATAPITIALGTNPGAATLHGTLVETPVNAVASFADLSVNTAGGGYTLVAAASGLASATSTGFDVTAAAPTKLGFTVQPTNAVAGSALAPAVQVAIEDAFGNTVSGASGNITLALGTNPGAATLAGTLTQTTASGIATFPGLSLNKAGTGYTLTATASSLTTGTSTGFNIAAGAPSQLAFTQQPTTAVSGTALTPAVQVAIQDRFGNTVPSATGIVTLAIGTNPSGGTLAGTLSRSVVNGVASFGDLTINNLGTGYTLSAASSGLLGATSGSFDITAGATKLAFIVQPGTTIAGAPIQPTVQVAIQDQFGNTVTTATTLVTVVIGANPGGGTLAGTASRSAVNGVATFSDLAINRAGSGYTLVAVAGTLATATSTGFDITAGPAAKLAFTVQPTGTVAGTVMTPSVNVTVQDVLGNTVTSYAGSVSVAIGAGSGSVGATLSGTTTKPTVAGVATFSDLRINKSGANYVLTASTSVLPVITSTTFNVTAGPPAKLVLTVQPSATIAGAAISPAVQVAVQDALGNTVASSNLNVTLAITPGTGNASGTLGGTTTVAAVAGIATFSNLTVDKAGTAYTLTATASGVASAISTGFDVVAGAAVHLVFSRQPGLVEAGSVLSPAVGVAAVDALGNTSTTFTGNVTVALTVGTGTSGATLAGTTTVTAAGGIASFATLSVDKAGTGYTFTAMATGLGSATSAPFTVAPGPPARLAFTGQPSVTQAGHPVSPAVRVAVQDALGNTVTSATTLVTVALGTNPGGSTLTGTLSENAVAGVASFADLSLDRAGTGYTLTATAAGVAGATSATFGVTLGAPSRLGFVVQPSAATAGSIMVPTLQVAAQDSLGNTVTAFSGSVTVAITSGTGNADATLSGTRTVVAAGGVASFADLSLDKVGTGYTLTVVAPGLTSAVSASFAVAAGPAARLAFTVEPPSTTASGATLTPAVRVTVQDGLGNTVSGPASVTLALTPGTGTSGATLSGTTTVAAVAGVALFSDLSVDKAGTGYTLSATASGLTGAASVAFAIVPAAANRLAFSVQPSTIAAGATMAPAVQVTILDAQGNPVPSASNTITLSVATNPNGGTLAGTLTRTAVNGVATFSDLSLDKAGAGYTLAATSGGLATATSAAFTVTPGSATQLAFTVQPSATVAGSVITPFVQVAVQDAHGNTVTSASSLIILALGANPGGGTLAGTLTRNAVSGVATFSDLTLNKAGTGYTLVATTSGLAGATSAAFAVTAGMPSRLAITGQPSTTAAGSIMAPALQVSVLDSLGNVDTTFAGNVAVAIGTNPGGGTLSGTLSRTALRGVASFSDLSIDRAATGYTFVATGSGLTGTTSSPFSITPGTASKLAFTVQPSSAAAGATLTPAVRVTVQDAFDNVVTSAAPSVTLAITSGTGTSGATLSGTPTLVAVGGVALFSDLNIDKAGTGYALTATSAGLTAATSSGFDIVAGAPAKLGFSVQPSVAAVGGVIAPAVRVAVQDALGNTVISVTALITVAIGTNPSGGTLSGTLTQSAVNGVATFGDLSINAAGSGYTLTTTASGVAGATSAPFTISSGTPARLVFTVQPTTSTAGSVITPDVQVTVRDSLGNTVTSATTLITLAIGTNPSGATLSGTVSRSAANGVASFSDLAIAQASSGYTLVATASGLAGGTSTAFDVTPGAATNLAVSVQPTATQAGATLTPALEVLARDAFGNTATSFTGNVTVAITVGTGAPGAVLSGTTTRPALAGVALFSDLSVDKAGSGYTLSTTASGLAGATSAAFAIVPAPASRLAFGVQPSNTVAGRAITPAVKVTAQDAFGNTDTAFTGSITVAITSGTGASGAVLSGTTTVTAVKGVATFGSLSVDKAGTGYTLTATAAGLGAATSSGFNITPSTLAFTVQPTTATAGSAIAPAIRVTASDTTFTGQITVAITAGTGSPGAVLSGTKTVNAVLGVATFSNLSINKAGNNYTLTASSTSFTSTVSTAFNITPGAAARLVFSGQPTTAAAGSVIAPAVQVTAADAFGNAVPSFTGSVTLAIASGTGAVGAQLGGTTTVTAVNGVATFANLTIDLAATGYRLAASATGLTSATSNAFNIIPGVAANLAFTVQPVTTSAGTSLTPAVQVTVQDSLGNTVTSSTAQVTVAIGTNPGGATLGGTLTQSAVGGIATFSALSLNTVGTGYTLTAAATGLAGATSASFNITPGSTTSLAFSVQPRTTPKGMNMTPALQVTARDAFGNTATGFAGQVTVAITTGTGATGAVLGGTLTVTAVNGVATFADLNIDTQGSAYTLTATSSGLTAATSTAFDITVATRLIFTVQPTTAPVSTTITPAVQVMAFDDFGNAVTNWAGSVAVAITSGTGTQGASLRGTNPLTTVNGTVTFSDLTITKVGTGYTLTATATGLASAISAAFNIQ
jgi:hypothetical protein